MSVKTSAPPAQPGQSPSTLSSIQRSSAHSDLQTISADYYNITDVNGVPLAGLLVLMDRKHRPVRAELQLNETTSDAGQEQAQRQAQLLIGDRYHGDHPLPLTVVRSYLEHERHSVPLRAAPPTGPSLSWIKPLVFALIAALLFGSAGWILNDRIGGNDSAGTLVASAPAAEEESDAAPAADIAADEGTEDASAEPVEERIYETNDLPVSSNATPMDVGQRVRILPGLQVAMRTEPGATAGEVVGTMKDGMEATIINGPVWLAGNSDTIVWWYVELDDGTQAWVAANTSELKLLEPIQ